MSPEGLFEVDVDVDDDVVGQALVSHAGWL